ncbi:DExH-box ATP-dependent RNA helicase DExH16, mitochondrial [Vitis vinifera]|uniref:DExH-box ATP-dependent RNA helicase DExH16, mitochondrial n=1 Tax=Vitis vinifera TaxID=29760 RepID=A0A438F712_VITVI|nr:DExH-box ATP-dependent RNA helicase DExH16, mitochondrial [Vitis vinifera]
MMFCACSLIGENDFGGLEDLAKAEVITTPRGHIFPRLKARGQMQKECPLMDGCCFVAINFTYVEHLVGILAYYYFMPMWLHETLLVESYDCLYVLHAAGSKLGTMEPFHRHLELRFRILVGVCNRIRQFSSSSSTSKLDFMDLTHPHTWYPNARRKSRKVIMHVGIYCGPLRLLAWEVAKRLNKANVPCDMITGQEREEIDGAKHKAMTVEMADVTSDYHCAVIDEIQAC